MFNPEDRRFSLEELEARAQRKRDLSEAAYKIAYNAKLKQALVISDAAENGGVMKQSDLDAIEREAKWPIRKLGFTDPPKFIDGALDEWYLAMPMRCPHCHQSYSGVTLRDVWNKPYAPGEGHRQCARCGANREGDDWKDYNRNLAYLVRDMMVL